MQERHIAEQIVSRGNFFGVNDAELDLVQGLTIYIPTRSQLRHLV